MPNKFKINKTGAETNSLFKGNWAVDVSEANTGGGPSSVTGFYNGVSIPTGGWIIYHNGKAYRAADQTMLLGYIRTIGGTADSLASALYWAANQAGIIIVDNDFEPIITDGLQFAWDADKLTSTKYGDLICRDLSTNQYDTNLPSGFNGKASLPDQRWSNEVDNITIQVLLEKVGTGTGYANHPIAKWNSNGTSTASFVLYHFENYQNNNGDGRIGYYANTQYNGWSSLTNQYRMSLNERVLVTLAYGSGDTHYWINDQLWGVIGNKGRLAPTVSAASGQGRPMEFSGPYGYGTSKVDQLLMYNRRLTQEEILYNYNSIKHRL